MGLISRVSSRTYRFRHLSNFLDKQLLKHFNMDNQQDNQNSEERMARTIFARNISFNATAEDFRAIPEFAQALDIKLPTDRETGRSRGFGFIEFNTPEECARALANARVEIHGREVVLAQSQPRQPGQGRGRGGSRGGGFRGGNRGGYGGRGGFGGGYGNQGGYNNNNFNRFDQGGHGGHQGGYGGQPQGGFGGQYGGQPQGGFGGQY